MSCCAAPPVIWPPTVSVFALTETVTFVESVTAPLPRCRFVVPAKVKKVVRQLCALLFRFVSAAPLGLSSVTLLLMVKVPVPSALEL